MYAVMLQTPVIPVAAQLWLWALAFAAVGVVGQWSTKVTDWPRIVGALVIALLLAGTATFAAVVGGDYAYGWCAYAWLSFWVC